MPSVRRNPDALRAISWGGLIGGVLARAAMLAFNVVSVNAVLALMLFIGLPIAFAVNRYASEPERLI